MAKNTIADLDKIAANNTDVLGQSTAGAASANTIDTLFQNTLGLIARAYGDVGALGTVGGTADNITLASLSTYQTLETGILLAFKAGGANTGAATLNLDSLGAKAIRRQGDSALEPGDILDDGIYSVVYDATYNAAAGAWVLLNPAAASPTPEISLLGTLTTTSGTTQSLTDIPQTYRSLQILLRDVSSNGTGGLQMKASDTNGSSYVAASSIGNTSQTASEKLQGLIEIFDYASSASFKLGRRDTNSSAVNVSGQIAPTVGAINALQFLWSAGNTFDGGEILIYGVK